MGSVSGCQQERTQSHPVRKRLTIMISSIDCELVSAQVSEDSLRRHSD